MYYIGLMSGTSMDAIDAVLVHFKNGNPVILDYRQSPLPADVRQNLESLNADTTIAEITRLDALLGNLFAEAVHDLLAVSGLEAGSVQAIGSHGQTVLHLPEDPNPRTLQIGDPARIAVLTGIPTVADFRRNDIAAGGQGAPLAPAFHAWRFRDPDSDRVVLNIGGMANITVLPADPHTAVTGFDTGPGNVLMDGWVHSHLGHEYDRKGEWAATGRCHPPLLTALLNDPYFLKVPPKSTGRDDFNMQWLKTRLASTGTAPPPADVQATLLELTARSICDAITLYAPATREVLVCGGGVHNAALMRRLGELLTGRTVTSTEAYGVPPDAVEAVTFAWLAKCRIENRPANLPSVTGAKRPVPLGAIYSC
jgi:anhydro-N-acetylmuramic acid kinase